jgi:GxxExxY protein
MNGMRRHHDLPKEIEDVSHTVIGCAIEVHRELGPGLLERLYEQALCHELEQSRLAVERQVDIRVPYKDILLDAQRVDVIVNGSVIVELKSVVEIDEVHKAQLLSYLRMTGLPLGLLINFNVSVLKDGLRRIINERSPVVVSSSLPSSLRALRVQSRPGSSEGAQT